MITSEDIKALRRELSIAECRDTHSSIFSMLDSIIDSLEKLKTETPEPIRICPKCGSHGMCHFACDNY